MEAEIPLLEENVSVTEHVPWPGAAVRHPHNQSKSNTVLEFGVDTVARKADRRAL